MAADTVHGIFVLAHSSNINRTIIVSHKTDLDKNRCKYFSYVTIKVLLLNFQYDMRQWIDVKFCLGNPLGNVRSNDIKTWQSQAQGCRLDITGLGACYMASRVSAAGKFLVLLGWCSLIYLPTHMCSYYRATSACVLCVCLCVCILDLKHKDLTVLL